MSSDIRVRFAPSPTGPLHIGGVRTALYNYLFAKKHGGTFVLRIEDTDQTRYVPGAEAYIMEALRWIGMEWDEGPEKGGPYGPYRQSERKEIYAQFAQKMIDEGTAYYAFDSAEDLEDMRNRMKKGGNPTWQYNHITRVHMKNSFTLPADEVQRRLDAGDPYVIRLNVPRNQEIRVEDIVRGVVVVKSDHVDDKVLFKSDGMPTYHLANVVDDYSMKITHVIRGEEWLPSAPLHVLLYKALGWEKAMPRFAHLPLILKPEGNGKLSKRDGDRLGFPVFPIEWKGQDGETASGYRENGWFPQAVVNLMALLGWHPSDNTEVFSMEELIQAFALERVSKAGAKFDLEKARWFNQYYLRQTSPAILADMLANEVDTSKGRSYLEKAIALVQDRPTFVPELKEDLSYLLSAPQSLDEQMLAKKWKSDSHEKVDAIIQLLNETDWQSPDALKQATKDFLEAKGWGFGSVMPLVRILLTGSMAGPDLFDMMDLFGKQETLNRLEQGLGMVKSKE